MLGNFFRSRLSIRESYYILYIHIYIHIKCSRGKHVQFLFVHITRPPEVHGVSAFRIQLLELVNC